MSRIKREGSKRNRLPLIGYLKCGERVKRGSKEIPQSLDYFKATGDYKKFFHDVYGEKPNKISIVFISDNTDDSCDERMEIRKGSKLYAHGNGEIFQVYDEKSDLYVEKTIEKNPDLIAELEKKCQSKFEDILTMRFIVLGVKQVFGFWQLMTKGKDSSIPQIVSVFDTVQETTGTIRNIPFDLVVQKVKSQKPNSKSLFPVITLIPNICKENLDRIGQLINTGYKITGLLSDQRITDIESEQLEYKDEGAVGKVKDTFSGQDVSDAEFELKDDMDIFNTDSDNLKMAKKTLRECKNDNQMESAIELIKGLKLTTEEKRSANYVRLEMLEVIKNESGS